MDDFKDVAVVASYLSFWDVPHLFIRTFSCVYECVCAREFFIFRRKAATMTWRTKNAFVELLARLAALDRWMVD